MTTGPGRQDLGLYQQKYLLRRWLDRIPGIARLQPNAVSLASIVPSAVAAAALYYGWWWLVILGIAGRMILTTLDGHIAENYGKRTRVGGYLNRVPAEIGDAMLILAIWPHAEPAWVALALVGGWMVNVFGLLGLVAGGSIQSVGPAGQTDRLAILAVVSAIAMVTPVDWTLVCQLLVALTALTVVLRVRRSIRELRAPTAS